MDLSLGELVLCPVINDMFHEARAMATVGGFQAIVSRHNLKEMPITGPDGSLYMTRYNVLERGNGGHIYFNCFHRPDGDQLPHDHPWDSEAMPLADGYVEEVTNEDGSTTLVEIRHGHINYIPASKWHRIRRLQYTWSPHAPRPVWTIQVTGPYKQSWGFREASGRKLYHKGYQLWNKALHELRTLRAHGLLTSIMAYGDVEGQIRKCIQLLDGRAGLEGPLATAREALGTLEMPVRT